MPDPLILVVMGVSGAGKTTISKLLAAALRCPLLEGDDLHPPLNVEKMHHGVALTDADRRPWLDKIAAAIDDWRARGQSGVVACSALKRSYRDIIIGNRADVRLIYLEGSRELIGGRLAGRRGHFMPPTLLDSQFATLEPPTPDEVAMTISVDASVENIIAQIAAALAPSGTIPCHPR